MSIGLLLRHCLSSGVSRSIVGCCTKVSMPSNSSEFHKCRRHLHFSRLTVVAAAKLWHAPNIKQQLLKAARLDSYILTRPNARSESLEGGSKEEHFESLTRADRCVRSFRRQRCADMRCSRVKINLRKFKHASPFGKGRNVSRVSSDRPASLSFPTLRYIVYICR